MVQEAEYVTAHYMQYYDFSNYILQYILPYNLIYIFVLSHLNIVYSHGGAVDSMHVSQS